MIVNMALEFIPGRIADSMKGTGTMVNNMEKVFIDNLMAQKEKENGKMEKEWLGQMSYEKYFEFTTNR